MARLPSYNFEQQEEEAFHAIVQSPENPQGVPKETLIQWQLTGNRLTDHPALKQRLNPKAAPLPGSSEDLAARAADKRNADTIAGPPPVVPKQIEDASGQMFDVYDSEKGKKLIPSTVDMEGGVFKQFKADDKKWSGVGPEGTPWTTGMDIIGRPTTTQLGKTPEKKEPKVEEFSESHPSNLWQRQRIRGEGGKEVIKNWEATPRVNEEWKALNADVERFENAVESISTTLLEKEDTIDDKAKIKMVGEKKRREGLRDDAIKVRQEWADDFSKKAREAGIEDAEKTLKVPDVRRKVFKATGAASGFKIMKFPGGKTKKIPLADVEAALQAGGVEVP